jgi:hypothetical protein
MFDDLIIPASGGGKSQAVLKPVAASTSDRHAYPPSVHACLFHCLSNHLDRGVGYRRQLIVFVVERLSVFRVRHCSLLPD